MVTDRPSYGHLGPDPLDELIQALQELSVPCGLGLPDGRVLTFGVGAPLFRILLRNELPLAGSITDLSLARGYVNGDIDVEGDVLSVLALRELIPFAVPVRQMLRLTADMLAPAAVANERAIDFHYSLGDDFYLTFLDRKYHFYSQCVFESEDETLEQAAEHKLERMWSALELQPGMSLLDIGGGWGGLASYAGERGVHVTSLTLNHDSAAYIRRRTGNGPNPAHVIIEDVLEHYPSEPYDHAVIFGVIEHVPNYRRFCRRLWGALRPGGAYTWTRPPPARSMRLRRSPGSTRGPDRIRVWRSRI